MRLERSADADGGSATEGLGLHHQLGAELRAAREHRGLSLRSVASAVGVSPSLLSQVETGKTQPSVGTLYALVTHLDLSLDALLRGERATAVPEPTHAAEESDPGVVAALRSNVIQRGEDNPVIEMQNGVTWERLAVGGSTLVDPLIVTYIAGASSGLDGRMMRHSGIEYGYILEGELTLRLDFDTFVLKAGDSFSFRSERPHLYTNHSSSAARGIWFVIGRRGDHGGADDERSADSDVQIHSAVDVLSVMGSLRARGQA